MSPGLPEGDCMYAIEKQHAGWTIYVHGVAIMQCADFDMALEVMQTAQEEQTAPARGRLGRGQRCLIVDTPVSPHAAAFTFLTDQPLGE